MLLSKYHYQTTPVGARSKQSKRAFATTASLPDYPCGGEIKTTIKLQSGKVIYYQTTPVGARSKLLQPLERNSRHITRLPLWGRDQNPVFAEWCVWNALPDYPCGGEIKTARLCGIYGKAYYQTSPVGARSKRIRRHYRCALHITRLPLWGRDQNRLSSPDNPKLPSEHI